MLEYAGLLSIIALAFFAFAMRGYLQNVFSGRMHASMKNTFGDEQHNADTNIALDISLVEKTETAGNEYSFPGWGVFNMEGSQREGGIYNESLYIP